MSASVAHRASTHAGRSVRGLGGADPRIQRCAHARRLGQGGLRRTTHPTATRTHRRHAREDAHRQHRGGVAVWCVCSTSKLRRSHSAAYTAQYALHGPLCVPGANAGARSARERHDRIRTDQSGRHRISSATVSNGGGCSCKERRPSSAALRSCLPLISGPHRARPSKAFVTRPDSLPVHRPRPRAFAGS